MSDDFGTRVKIERTRRKITREKLASDLGVPTPTIKGWENDGRIPGADVAVRLARYFSTSVEYLVDGIEVKHRPLTFSQERWLEIVDGMPDDMIERYIRQLDEWTRMALELQRMQ